MDTNDVKTNRNTSFSRRSLRRENEDVPTPLARLANKSVVIIGGGTGTFTVLSGLKHYGVDLTAVVTMADDGGSTGRLRDEFGVLPPGDLRQCLVALSEADQVMRKLFNYRFDKGELAGHAFGNIFISTLEKVTGSLDRALDVAGRILNIRGRVIPVTLSKVSLVAELKNGKVLHGESALSDYQLVSRFGVKKIFLTPKAKANPKALRAIKEADLIVVGPGNLYASLIPNFLVAGIGRALIASKAKKVYVANLMNKNGHTDDFLVSDYVRVLEAAVGSPARGRPRAGKKGVFDAVVYNTKKPAGALLRKYADEGEPVVCGPKSAFGRSDERFPRNRFSPECLKGDFELIGTNLLADDLAKTAKKDMLRRTLIRHDSEKLAKVLMSLIN
ncbi:MAG TPA: gluconeogenesis factor YvcK family protein [Candidatus Paceibacterota bacterium]